MNGTRQQQQHTTETKYAVALPDTKATACFCERRDTVWEKSSVTDNRNVGLNQVSFYVWAEGEAADAVEFLTCFNPFESPAVLLSDFLYVS